MLTWLVSTHLCHSMAPSITTVCPATFPASKAEQMNGSNTCALALGKSHSRCPGKTNWAGVSNSSSHLTPQAALNPQLVARPPWLWRKHCQLSLPLQHRQSQTHTLVGTQDFFPQVSPPLRKLEGPKATKAWLPGEATTRLPTAVLEGQGRALLEGQPSPAPLPIPPHCQQGQGSRKTPGPPGARKRKAGAAGQFCAQTVFT